jgi:multidrug resistance efflux pump
VTDDQTHANLTELTDQLESAAAQLRGGDLEVDAAAALVEECARLAARAATELDRLARSGGDQPGQDRLL